MLPKSPTCSDGCIVERGVSRRKRCFKERGVSRKEVYQGKRCFKERGVSRKEVFQGKRCFKERGVSRVSLRCIKRCIKSIMYSPCDMLPRSPSPACAHGAELGAELVSRDTKVNR